MHYIKVTENKKIILIDEVPLCIMIYFWVANTNRCSCPKKLIEVEAEENWVSKQFLRKYNKNEKELIIEYLHMRYSHDNVDIKKLYKKACRCYDLRRNNVTFKQYLKQLKGKINPCIVSKILESGEIHYPDQYGIGIEFKDKIKNDIKCYMDGDVNITILEEIFRKLNYQGMSSMKSRLEWLQNEYFLKFEMFDYLIFEQDDIKEEVGHELKKDDFETFVIKQLLDGEEWLYDRSLPYDIQLYLLSNGYISKKQVVEDVENLISTHDYMRSALECFYISESMEQYKKNHYISVSSKLKKEIQLNNITNIYELEFWNKKNAINYSNLKKEILELVEIAK